MVYTASDQRGRTRAIADTLWGDSAKENTLMMHNPLPTKISGALTQEQVVAYQVMYRIQEITSKLRTNDLSPPYRRSRSPSPPPVYDTRGKRTNTREQRFRRKLEEERHRMVEIALKMIPHFVAPDDYKRPTRFQDKYYIPIDQYPDINFMGLLLGPRGNTLRKLQEDSGCKIAIRGQGSVKEGKNASELPKGAMNFEDPLHCVITADSEEKIQKGIKACENVVVKAVTSPEGQNDLKRGQLRELAELNGTLREDNRPCPVCGLQGHKRFECPNRTTFAQKIVCKRCGQAGHATQDCTIPQTNEGRHTMYSSSPAIAYQRSSELPLDSKRPFDFLDSEQNDWKRPNLGPVTAGSNSRYNNNDNRYNSFENALPAPTSYKSRQNRDRISTDERFTSEVTVEATPPAGPPGFDSNSAPFNADSPSEQLTVNGPPGTSINVPSVAQVLPPGLDAPPGLMTVPGLVAPPGLNFSTDASNSYSNSDEVAADPATHLSAPPGLSGPPGL